MKNKNFVANVTSQTAAIDIRKEQNQAMSLLGRNMNSFCLTNDVASNNHHYFPISRAHQELPGFVYLLPCNRPYNVKLESALEITNHGINETNSMNNFCNAAQKLLNSNDPGQVICSAIQ